MEEQCIICEKEKEAGIHIFMNFICDDCEAEIVRTDTRDEKYPFFIHRLKQIWYKTNMV